MEAVRTAALAGCVAAAVVTSFAMDSGVPPWTAAVWLPLFGISFLLGRRTRSHWPAVVFAGGAAGGVTGVVLVGVTVAVPWFLGRTGYQQAALARAEVEAAHLRERTRIAHEAHDSLGHELSLLALQAGALEMTVPPEHQRAAAQLRETASQATERLAALVFLLRDGEPAALTSLRDLVERATEAGMVVEFTVDGDPPSTVERTVHRIVQEGLTNAAKHAPRAEVRIRVTSADGSTVVEMSNDVGGRRGAGSRLGLVALGERVRIAGGTLRTSRHDGRFELVATVPHTGER
ncbi:sensor histidine kinase [Lentzea sp. JNUCC 0626]|uniref:sensor histidine kinase n=1 Tax=Lentzea sp. JNUCC 0626 TaxID=3367513 RepID=UPI0037489BEB